jgi:hypothetical protein
VGLKRKGGERKTEWKVVLENVKKGSVAPLELSDGVIKQVKAMAKGVEENKWGNSGFDGRSQWKRWKVWGRRR